MQTESFRKLGQFLSSASGGIIVAAAIGALGLFTWQRRDWVFKEQYHRNEVLTDRAVELVQKINVDTGMFIAQANDLIAAYQKRVPSTEISQEIETYNQQQAKWFGSYISDSALIGFYFPRQEMTTKFTEIAQTTEDLDRQIYLLSAGQKTPLEVHEVAERVRSLLGQWNTLALSNLPAVR
jgi:hypothetical protein